MFDMLSLYARSQPAKLHEIERVINVLNDPTNLTLIQAYLLAAVVNSYEPEIIFDLGTGRGNSAAVFSVAAPSASISTFDLDNKWEAQTIGRLRPLDVGNNVHPFVGDMTALDFTPMIGQAKSIVVFWDAHGYEIADHVLAHIMPLIANRKHIVVCHDMSNADVQSSLGYDGKPAWHGMKAWYDTPGNTAYVVVGWTMTNVDQVVPIVDFCARNKMSFRSVDADIHIDRQTQVPTLSNLLGVQGLSYFHMGYFSMNETDRRFFPGKMPHA